MCWICQTYVEVECVIETYSDQAVVDILLRKYDNLPGLRFTIGRQSDTLLSMPFKHWSTLFSALHHAETRWCTLLP